MAFIKFVPNIPEPDVRARGTMYVKAGAAVNYCGAHSPDRNWVCTRGKNHNSSSVDTMFHAAHRSDGSQLGEWLDGDSAPATAIDPRVMGNLVLAGIGSSISKNPPPMPVPAPAAGVPPYIPASGMNAAAQAMVAAVDRDLLDEIVGEANRPEPYPIDEWDLLPDADPNENLPGWHEI